MRPRRGRRRAARVRPGRGLGAAGGGRACGGPGQQQLGRGRCGLAWGGAAAEIGRRWRRRWGSAGGVVNGKDVCEDFFFFYRNKPRVGVLLGFRVSSSPS